MFAQRVARGGGLASDATQPADLWQLTNQWSQIRQQLFADDVVTGSIQQITRHRLRFLGNGCQGGDESFDAIWVVGALESNRATAFAAEDGFDCGDASKAGLAGIDVADHAGEAALEIAKGVGADAVGFLGHRFLEVIFQRVGEEVAESTGARELLVTVRIDFLRGNDFSATGSVDAFAHCDDAATNLAVHGFNVATECIQRKVRLGAVDQVRAVTSVDARECRRGGQPTGVAAHHNVDLHARERAVVEVVTHERLGDEFRRRAVAGAVVSDAKIVVDRLRAVETGEIVAALLGHIVDDVGGLSSVIAADVEEGADIQFFEACEDQRAVIGRSLTTNTLES